ncbi:hypothetical protein [Niabella beijingensis]|uniref:hypothetical protein n=1 Tax=Niabella beijingensis TaxID=2872700 RepID=UPI001CBC62F2|nr:hypothetical protein [Niabella beijingensis]MBZ4191018.1 hypothetical protein [Niabella beijingensis]
MILPIIPFRKSYHIEKNVAYFFGNNKMEDILFGSIQFDKLNLCTDVKEQDPLTVEFRNIKNWLNEVPATTYSITIDATFLKTTPGTKINIVLKTNPFLYYFYSIFGAGLIYLSITEKPYLFSVLLLFAVAMYDIFSKKMFLSRFEEIVNAAA